LPITANVVDPGVAVTAAVTVIAAESSPVARNVNVTPVMSAVVTSETPWLNPCFRTTAIVVVADEPPAWTVRDDGVAVSAKPGFAFGFGHLTRFLTTFPCLLSTFPCFLTTFQQTFVLLE
jgi:hypothetical protein